MDENFQMREFFNRQVVQDFAARLHGVWPDFNKDGFTRTILEKLDDLQLRERSELITDALYTYLPKNFSQAVGILLKALTADLKQNDSSGPGGFIIMPQTRYISRYGMEHYELSMQALYEMTQHFTAEWDLGYFIEAEMGKTLKILDKWTKDPNPQVRRLVSEGTRPRLPWGRRLKPFQKDPRPVIALLEKLKNDPELYVRRSVANNLNDIAKDNPDITIEMLRDWHKDTSENMQWLIKHALRTLLKQGNKDALEILGYPKHPEITVTEFEAPAMVQLGTRLQFSFKVTSQNEQTQRLMIDYCIHFRKANGRQLPKVFKLAQKELAGHSAIRLARKHMLQNMTTRTMYPGEHQLELLINGNAMGKRTFMLLA